MNTRLAEIQELSRIRENVHRSVAALELCERCERISECQQWLLGDALVWRCGECASDFSDELQIHADDSQQHAGVSQQFSQKQAWVRQCSRCKGTLEKELAADDWSCPRCGWR